jgi:Na+/H+-dicarboxylate symporter
MRMNQPTRILAALAVGLLLWHRHRRAGWVEGAIAFLEPVGGLWLDALRMTIVPLVVSLLITGIAASAKRRGRASLRDARWCCSSRSCGLRRSCRRC